MVSRSIPRIETSRLVLREWHTSDLAPFAALNADPKVMEHFPSCLTREESDDLVVRIEAHFGKHGFGLWAVEVRDAARFIGFVGLSTVWFESHFTPCVEIGWRLARAYWGCGYAPEAARAALRFGFETLGLDEIASFTVPANLKSRRVMEKIGMIRNPGDDFDHPSLPAGHPLRRHVLYRLVRKGATGRKRVIPQHLAGQIAPFKANPFLERLNEAVAWCCSRPRPWTPLTCFRSMEIAPEWLSGRRGDVVRSTTHRRSMRLRELGIHATVPYHGRLLAYFPEWNLSHGLEEEASEGFVTFRNEPPWDTWVDWVAHEGDGCTGFLVSWVPPDFEPVVQAGIDSCPDDSIQWLDTLEVPVARELLAAVRAETAG
jgi:ribosomal-protein-alanine N-acetyltransferase